MVRTPRQATGNIVYHALNRANGRMRIFNKDQDYKAFEKILLEAKEKYSMRLLSYCIMPNHWHLCLYPLTGESLWQFMRWITVTHTQRWHAHYSLIGYGHLYQGRYKSFPVQTDLYFLQLCRYIERNPLRAELIKKAQDWRWSSLWIRENGTEKQKKILSKWPVDIPNNYLEIVNNNNKNEKEKLEQIRLSVKRGRPYGDEVWVDKIAQKLGLMSTIRSRGRPKKGT